MSIGEEDEDRSRMKGIYQRSNFFFFFRFEILGGCLQRAWGYDVATGYRVFFCSHAVAAGGCICPRQVALRYIIDFLTYAVALFFFFFFFNSTDI